MGVETLAYRPLIIGRRGAVAANHPLAAQAGLLALRAGGNAVDAAVATGIVLSVVEPMMSGLGGDAFYQVFDAASGSAIVFNGTGPAPAAATPERYAGGIPRTGPLSVSVPGMLAGHGPDAPPFGRLPWRELFRRRSVCPRRLWRHPRLLPFRRRIPPNSDGRSTYGRAVSDRWPPPRRWARRSCSQISRAPSKKSPRTAPTAFTAAGSRAGLQPAWKLPARWSESGDLAEFIAEEQQPIAVDYRGYSVLEAPPNSTGFVLLRK